MNSTQTIVDATPQDVQTWEPILVDVQEWSALHPRPMNRQRHPREALPESANEWPTWLDVLQETYNPPSGTEHVMSDHQGNPGDARMTQEQARQLLGGKLAAKLARMKADREAWLAYRYTPPRYDVFWQGMEWMGSL